LTGPPASAIMAAMRTGLLLLSVLVLTEVAFSSGKDSLGFISGIIRDGLTGESIPRADVTGAVTDSAGRFAGKFRPGQHVIKAEAPGYAPASANVEVSAGRTAVIDFRLLPEDYVSDSLHRMVGALKCVEIKGWWPTPDSAAIRDNNKAVLAAVSAFRGRRRGLFHRPSYALHGLRCYLVVGKGKCKLILEPDMPLGYQMDDVDSLRVGRGFPRRDVPAWGTRKEYVPLSLDAFIRDRHYWVTVVYQGPVLWR